MWGKRGGPGEAMIVGQQARAQLLNQRDVQRIDGLKLWR